MSKKRKYWYQMNFVEWMWQEHKVVFIFLAPLFITGVTLIIIGLFYG
jgi:hypothetical protein